MYQPAGTKSSRERGTSRAKPDPLLSARPPPPVNPILVTGSLAVAASAAGMLVSFSADHAEYSRSVELASAAQSERIREQLSVERGPDGEVRVRNTGAVPVTILEVRTVGAGGQVTSQEQVRLRVPAGQSAALP